ncbi:DUF6247 family protein [Streptomyces sp. NPDC097981]|uniref:DUF6247 family protein n=1 Tax=Streptomyces sp. NPDC097981 TaxID=3155428 RepID=UPI003325E8AC
MRSPGGGYCGALAAVDEQRRQFRALLGRHGECRTPHPAPRLRADRRADTWVPAFERDWAKALEDSRHSYSLTPLHDVVRAWQLRVATAPAVDVLDIVWLG